MRVEGPREVGEGRATPVSRPDDVGRHREQLRPVRPRGERLESGLDRRQERPDRGPVGLPGEVVRDRCAAEGRAQPQVVGGDGADLPDEQEGGDAVAEAVDGVEGRRGVATTDEVLGLEFLAAAGRVVEAEVRQPLVPWPGDPELGRGGVGRHASDRVAVDRRRSSAEEGLRRRGLVTARRDAALDPDLLDSPAAPVGEAADAVAGRRHLVEMRPEGVRREVLVDPLADVERRLDREGQARDGAQASQ